MNNKKYTCNACGKSFLSYNLTPKFCSFDCRVKSQIINIDFEKVKNLYESGMSQDEIAKELNTTQNVITNTFRRNKYKCRIRVKRNQKGDRNDSWKGDHATYAAFHYRVESHRGKPKHCSICNTTEQKRYEWANLTGKYEDIMDYARMCVKCHRNYDKNRPNSMKHVKQKK